jgi:hypothetical protein
VNVLKKKKDVTAGGEMTQALCAHMNNKIKKKCHCCQASAVCYLQGGCEWARNSR